MKFQTLVAATLASGASAHGTMINPPQWPRGNEMYENYTFVPEGVGPYITTYNPLKTMKECPKYTIPSKRDSAGNSLGCYGSRGLEPGKGVDATFDHPWRSPGTAPITSPCGINGGNPLGCPKGNPYPGNCNSGGFGHGADGRLGFNTGKVTTWAAGSIQDIEWYVHANHNGGYSYRLVKKPANAMDLKEEDFLKNSLKFTGNHLIKYHNPLTPNKEIVAMDTTEAETPGQYWRRNPIPCCTWLEAGPSTSCTFPAGPQFEPQKGSNGEKLMGYGPFKDWNIVDKVIIPADLEAGDYILSWRWDTEEFAQVWTSCSQIRITNGGPTPAPTPPAPTPTPSPEPTPSPCFDKDHNCSAVSKATCGSGIGGCIKNNCDPSIYDAEVVAYDGHTCMYHCKCLNPGTTLV